MTTGVFEGASAIWRFSFYVYVATFFIVTSRFVSHLMCNVYSVLSVRTKGRGLNA